MARFDKVIKQLEKLASEQLFYEVQYKMGLKALEFVEEEFKKQVDPYSNPWAPRKETKTKKGKPAKSGLTSGQYAYRYKTWPILDLSGEYKNSFVVSDINPEGFELYNPKEFASYHQEGTKKMVARKTLPDENNLPLRWQQAFEVYLALAVDKIMK